MKKLLLSLALVVLVVIGNGCNSQSPPKPESVATSPPRATTEEKSLLVIESDFRVANDPKPAEKTATNPTSITLLNVSYDPTRELYEAFNRAFARHWQATTGQEVLFQMSHGGSGKQARSVIDGLEADVVTLALAHDINEIVRRGELIDANWQKRLPNNSAPYTSTIVFLVRAGNPKNIRDWEDLVQGDVSLVAANPKTGGGARWNYLAAWGYTLRRELGSLDRLHDPTAKAVVDLAQAKAREFVAALYRRVAVLDSGARGATVTFTQRGIGDALICWENEALLARKELGADKFEIVVPSVSILAEPPVAVVDRVAEKHGTKEVADAYLRYLYTSTGQTLAAQHGYRPMSEELVPSELQKPFARIELFRIDPVFGGWDQAQETHFADGGVYDQIYTPKAPATAP